MNALPPRPLQDQPTPAPVRAVRLGTSRASLWARRAAFAGPVALLPLLGTWLAAGLTAGAPGPLRPALLALLFGNLLYLALTGWPGVLGFLARLARPTLAHPTLASPRPDGSSRTAVLFPVYNEDPRAVFAAVEAMAEALVEQGVPGTDIFVLSDTQDPATAAAELVAFARLERQFGNRVRYRRRPENLRRKVGNIAEFCATWSARYDCMVVLDADSLMSAATIAALAGLMEANPQAGLIQTVPYAVGRETLFARIQQFAARLYTPLLVEGLAFWQRGDGNYWGHNAIVRIAPFMAHCDLPTLPGREPFGGEILCHDVVEAALMRRGGWEVWLLPALGESYEALPANMIDFAQRERRWCQGNLQHLGVLPMPGLPAVGRYHLALGVLNYLSGPLLTLFAALATLDGLLGGQFMQRLLGQASPQRTGLIVLTFLLLYAAKLCSLAAALWDGRVAARFGGRARLLASAALEQAAAMISAPVLLVFYTRFILMMLLGRSVRWDAQPRDDRGVSWAEAAHRLRLPAVVGLAWLAGVSALGGAALHWSLSLLPGLLLAVPCAVWSSLRTAGLAARRRGLFLTEDELTPSPILRAFGRAVARGAPPSAVRPAKPLAYLHALPEGEAD